MAFLVLLVGITVTVQSTNSCVVYASYAGGLPTPSVPEFTVTITDNSYDVPPVYGTDPFTNETIVLEEGHHIQNKTINLVITNQAFSCSNTSDYGTIRLYHSIRVKGHFEDSWWYPDYSSYIQLDENENHVNYVGAVGEYTKKTFGMVGNNDTKTTSKKLAVSEGGQIDFQVQAFIGYRNRVNDTFVPGAPSGDPTDLIPHHYVFIGETSEWSEIQTLTIPKTDAEVIPEEPVTDELESNNEWFTQFTQIATVLGVVVIVVVLLVLIKKSRSNLK
jgi:hypothetical protein